MMALHQIRDVPVRGQEGLSLNLRLASKTPLRRRSIMGLSERKTPPYQTQEASTAPKHPRTKNDHVRAALSPRVRLANTGRSPPQCPCERTRFSSTSPIYLATIPQCSHTQSCLQASPSGLSDRSATNKSHTLQTREQQKSRSDGI